MDKPPFLLEQSLGFPDPNLALTDPDGLLAIGGDLSPQRVLMAYRQGVFPWFNADQPILWWSPSTRALLDPYAFKCSKSLKKLLTQDRYTLQLDTRFQAIINSCAQPRVNSPGTWITPSMQKAYLELHRMGFAHSVEVYRRSTQKLVGGLYGVSLGRFFFGESMFSTEANTSKIALWGLSQCLIHWKFKWIDCQIWSAHLGTLGAKPMPRKAFLSQLCQWGTPPDKTGVWSPPERLEIFQK